MMKLITSKKYLLVFFALLFFLVTNITFASSNAGHNESGDSHEHASKGWVSTDTYKVMNFALLAIVLFILLKKPVSDSLNGRIKDIKKQIDDLEEQKKQAQIELSKYNRQIEDMQNKSDEIISEYVKQGISAKNKILDEAKKMAEKLQSQAVKNIEQEINQAKISLKQEIFEKAAQKAEDLIIQNIEEYDQERLVSEYIEKVVA